MIYKSNGFQCAEKILNTILLCIVLFVVVMSFNYYYERVEGYAMGNKIIKTKAEVLWLANMYVKENR